MASVLWRTLLNASLAANTKLPEAHFMQLATIKLDGRPANRTVLFRGFVPDSNKLLICTDTLSAKIGEIQKFPHASVCWYFYETREQFRFDVDLECITSETIDPTKQKIFHQVWEGTSDGIKRSFTGESPGQSLDPKLKEDYSKESAIKRCCVVVLEPLLVDYYDCRTVRRFIHTLNNGVWTANEVHI